ncbi:uncharacterized protein LOC132803655 isoform X2 [Ziziphus jujuba]|uniref:Uncharacterized protein LOC132803655 isoform X2 n=1 Tax=Ziziphus jujuba TaxID=326968 RepID=A0ABM4A8B3_ZIZJJ|nr:uncharacterized protein LOC107421571 isoform X3 [Ziziphus jujuba var. spinosa]XP_060672961.1 uncharacterized protein LOC132803655 isoform X2 [Ziziphus jujuba]
MANSLVVSLKIWFSVLGFVMVLTLVYTLSVDGLPFRKELLTPWMTATLVDFYINVVFLAAWVLYKESNWISTTIWIILLVCFGRDDVEQKRKHSPVVITRVIFIVLGCLMSGTLVYTILTDGSPFRKELLTPWMIATLIDFYINVIALSVWVAHTSSTFVAAIFWIVLLICFGSIATCIYIVQQLFHLTTQDPVYLVLLKSEDRAESRYEGTLL